MHVQVNGTDLAWSSSTSGPPQLDPRGSYKLPEGGFASMGPTVSPVALSKFLTAVSGKQFQNPPSEMLVSRGLLIHDLLELFSGKPMPGRVGACLSALLFLPSFHHCFTCHPSGALYPFLTPPWSCGKVSQCLPVPLPLPLPLAAQSKRAPA